MKLNFRYVLVTFFESCMISGLSLLVYGLISLRCQLSWPWYVVIACAVAAAWDLCVLPEIKKNHPPQADENK